MHLHIDIVALRTFDRAKYPQGLFRLATGYQWPHGDCRRSQAIGQIRMRSQGMHEVEQLVLGYSSHSFGSEIKNLHYIGSFLG